MFGHEHEPIFYLKMDVEKDEIEGTMYVYINPQYPLVIYFIYLIKDCQFGLSQEHLTMSTNLGLNCTKPIMRRQLAVSFHRFKPCTKWISDWFPTTRMLALPKDMSIPIWVQPKSYSKDKRQILEYLPHADNMNFYVLLLL